MMRKFSGEKISYFAIIWALSSLMLLSCEEKIDLKIQDTEPKIVIQGEINAHENFQNISIFETVGLQGSVDGKPVSGAEVAVVDSRGRTFNFVEISAGKYQSKGMQGRSGMEYNLSVRVQDQAYVAKTKLPEMVQVDSIGTYSTFFFGQDNKFVTIKFQDPANIPNYYRYYISVNDSEFEYIGVYSDRYNDGKYISHELALRDRPFESGDKVRIHRQCIDQASYDFWSSRSFSNPGAAAPANPKSNISNRALGFFGSYTQLVYQIQVP